MKKQIGNTLALYPTPLVVVGAMVDGKPNWLLVGHLGIIGHDRVMVSLAKPHYTNRGIKASCALSINIVDEAMLPKADYTGCVSGSKQDKSEVFSYKIGEAGAPLIDAAPVSMSCTVEDIPAGVKHWHGAAKDSWFVHLAVEVPGEDTANEWLEPVTDEEYHKLP